MSAIPRERVPESTLPFLRDPYRFISRRRARHGTDLFEARILLEPTLCMGGAEAARLFYDARFFERAGAAPRRVRKTLFGEGGVQGLDGAEHRRRKALLMSLMTPDEIDRLARIFAEHLDRYALRWRTRDHVVLLDELHEILARAVTEWVGLRVAEGQLPRLTRKLVAMFESRGAVGPRHVRGRRARRRVERRLGRIVERVRAQGGRPGAGTGAASSGASGSGTRGSSTVASGFVTGAGSSVGSDDPFTPERVAPASSGGWRPSSDAPSETAWDSAVATATLEPRAATERLPLRALALHRDVRGAPLDAGVVAVELLNLLRPTVAVARFITFGALALYVHPWVREMLFSPDAEPTEWFVHEVRRFYPFLPVVAARVRRDAEWNGYVLPAGRRALLDLYGTNRDPRFWDRPDEFLPERFQSWDGDPFRLIPQGGGDHLEGHRCAGEWITIELMKRALWYLANEVRYDVPPQNLWVDMGRAPAAPESGFVMTNVRGVV